MEEHPERKVVPSEVAEVAAEEGEEGEELLPTDINPYSPEALVVPETLRPSPEDEAEEVEEMKRGERWNFKKPIGEIAAYLASKKPGQEEELYLKTASDALLVVWKHALADTAAGKSADFSYLKELGVSDDSVAALSTLIQKYKSDPNDRKFE